MSEVFEKRSAAWDAELRKQVDLLWPREVERVEAYGLNAASTVLDLGTGNGYFLSRLAERHPRKNFMGIEASPSLAAMAQRGADEGKAANMKVLHGSCPLAGLKTRFDLVMARLSLYCMPNREEVLRWAHGLLNEGGRIVIIDVDDGMKTCWPPSDLWELFVPAIARDIGPDADRLIGRKLPQLLLKAGFRDVKIEFQPWYSSTDLGAEAFTDFWSGGARQMAGDQPDIFGAGGLAKVLDCIAEIARSSDKVALTFECVVSAAK
jgi:SAM-dependent methyltransferase